MLDLILMPAHEKLPAKQWVDKPALDRSPGVPTRIMIVEDDFLISIQMEEALRTAGFEVTLASSSEEALQIAGGETPTLVVMDVRLPGTLDGVDTALELFKTYGIRSIFSTAHSDLEIRARAAPAQPIAWLTKPYSMASLVAAVQSALGTGNS